MNLTAIIKLAYGNACTYLQNQHSIGQSTRLMMKASSKHNYQDGSMKAPSHLVYYLKPTAKTTL